MLIWDWCNTEYLSIHLIWENRWHIKMCYKKCICSLSSHKSSTSGLGLTYWWFTSEQFATWIWWILFSTESLHQKQINQQFMTIGYFGMYYFLSLDGIQITWVVCYNSLMNHNLMTITFIITPFEYGHLQQKMVTPESFNCLIENHILKRPSCEIDLPRTVKFTHWAFCKVILDSNFRY